MKRYFILAAVIVAAMLSWTQVANWWVDASVKPNPLVQIDKALDQRTVVKKSLIPGAGNGLFAVVKIKRGQVIGHLGGRLLAEFPQGNPYVGALIECAQKEAQPYRFIDSKDHGANVSRINFAPRKINGIETHFQNAGIKRLCKTPYFEFVALQEIAAGAEIWSSYGEKYDYERFMRIPEVRDFFCGLLKTDCRKKYTYEH